MASSTTRAKKTDVLGILPLQDAVLFPNTVIPLAVVKKPGIALVEEALRDGRQIGLVALKDKDIDDPGPDDVRRVGTLGTIQKHAQGSRRDDPLHRRRKLRSSGSTQFIAERSRTSLRTSPNCPTSTEESDELVAMHRNLAGLFSKLLGYLPQAPREMEMEVNNITRLRTC